jgi:hypothetical protein
LGDIHWIEALEQDDYEIHVNISKTMYLKATKGQGTSHCWLGAGRACFALQEYQEAEDAFCVSIFLK